MNVILLLLFFFLIQMNFGLIVNLDLKRALFPQEVRKVQKIASINQPFKTIPQYLALCQTKPSLPCYNHCMLHYVIDYVKFHQLSFSVSVKFYLDFYLFFLLLKQSIQQGCFFLFLFVIQKDFNLLKWRSVFFLVRLFLVLLGKNLVHIRFD